MKQGKKILVLSLSLLAASSTAFLYTKRPFRVRMAAFVTDLSARSSAQRQNIRRAGQVLSGEILLPGEIFSLNRKAGPYTAERGFLVERSFSEKQLVLTPGGGVCQLASTLYNAALRAGLEIVERVPHSGPVVSVPPGADATLAYGYADLKLKNPHPYPVKIVSRQVGDQWLVEIWGEGETKCRTPALNMLIGLFSGPSPSIWPLPSIFPNRSVSYTDHWD
ncbi:MAG TPA: vanomycin resistance protein VanB [Deltaproteobacteria bacterium]|nr:vanomycin resistance protein VanB [Deltaproteobacteria bacterium]